MLPAPEPVRLTLPPAPDDPVAPPFPWVATLAPVAMALVLFAVTRTPYTLMFAALGPLVAVGAAVDGRRSRRRTARRAAARTASDVSALVERAAAAQRRERERVSGRVEGGVPVLAGWGRVASAVVLDGAAGDDDGLRMLRAAAADPHDAPVVLDALDGIGVVGSPVHVHAVVRSLIRQVAAGPPLDPDAGAWTHDGVTIAWAEAEHLLPAACGVRIDLDAGSIRGPGVIDQDAGFTAAALTSSEAAAFSSTTPASRLPDHVELSGLLPSPRDGLAAPIGRDARGPVVVDLIADGPHAVVAGTTGSGKSELLVTWVLALAAARTPQELSLLLIDFKGGAAFAPLAALPHVTGILSDLDPRLTRRAIQSLRAELLRRERLLADAGARAIHELPPGRLARLVIVVDEFAALVASGPELHDVFADLAARGRSLGLHLILCTQRPSGVVRDAVLANVGLRICLRVTDRGDSVAMVGDDAAARLAVEPRGRAILQRDGEAVTLQVAVSSPADASAAAGGHVPASGARPWLDPLPARIAAGDLPATGEPGIAFGMLDLPASQRQPAAVYDPSRHGHLLVLGAGGAGATTALATLAAGATRPLVLSADPADAWAQLADPHDAGLLLIDGVDALLAAAGPDLGHELAERIAGLLRGSSPAVAASARRLGGAVAGLAGLFGSRLLLRQSSRDEHLLAGGAHDDFDSALPAGAGTWRGDVIQVADSGSPLPPVRVPELPRVVPGADPVLAVIAARPDALAPRLAGVWLVRLGHDATGELAVSAGALPTVVLGDPDAWQAEWHLLTTARRSWPIVLVGCTPSDHRALLREAQAPPPLGRHPAECWLSREGRSVRAVLDPSSTRDSEEKREVNR